MQKTRIKKLLFLIFDILLIFMMLSSYTKVFAEEILNSDVEDKAKALIEIAISKYNNFNIEEKNGSLLEFDVKTGIEYKDNQNYGAIKKTTTLIKIPELNGELPERVEVIAESTKATNGQTSNITGNYSYDKEEGIVQIIASNEGEEPYNKYDSLARDEYKVICIYGENVYTNQNEERNIDVKAVVSEELYNEEIGNIMQTASLTQNVTENIGTIISSDIRTENIYDGYIKSNRVYGTSYETIYKETMNMLVSYRDIGEKIVLEQSNSWQDENNQTLNNIENIVYKSTKISKEDMINILGENGTIRVIAEDGSILQEINKDTQEAQSGIIEILYQENTENIKLEFSTPIKEGTIRLQNDKVIKGTVTDLNVKKIITNEKISLSEQVVENTQKVTEIESAKSNIKLEVDNNNLGNGITNNIILTATLQSNSNEYNLFKNPVLRITLPSEVEKVVLGDISILYGNGLNIAESYVRDNNGNKEIIIRLEGEQTAYNIDTISNGTNVIIPANIILKNEILSTQSSIKASYTNEVFSMNKFVEETRNCEDIAVNIVNTINSEEESDKEEILTSDENNNIENIQNSEIVNQELRKSGIELEVYAQIGNKKIENGDSVHTSEIIKYVINVKNTSNTTMNNVVINCQIPENTVYATVDRGSYFKEAYKYVEDPDLKEYTLVANTLEPGETNTGFYEVVVKDLEEGIDEKEISNTVSASINDEIYDSVTLQNKLIKSNLDVYLKSYIGRDQKNSFVYYLEVKNLTNKTINNVNVESTDFQKELNVFNAYYYTFDEFLNQKFGTFENGKLEGTIPSIDPGETITIIIETEAYNFEDNVSEVPLIMSVHAYSDENDIYYSNENRRTAYPTYVTLKMSSDKEGEEVKHGEEVTYKLEIKNESKIRTTAHVYDYLPENLEGISLEYEAYHIIDDGYGETIYDIEQEANISYELEKIDKDLSQIVEGQANIDEYLEIPAGKTVVMTIKARTVDTIETVQISNYATAERTEEEENEGIKTVTSNIVSFTLLSAYDNQGEGDNNGDNGDNGNQNGDDNNSGTGIVEPYSISGVAWLDANRDGKRDDTEELLSGIQVKLYDANTQTIAKNENGQTLKTTTDEQGRYIFSNVKNGNYWVLFEYDSSNYSLTSYQKSNVSSTLNSDAIAKNVSIDGTEKNVGMTDTLTIADNGLTNIDMGLVSNSKFDLKLDKYISQVVVETSKGFETYDYQNTQFAKVEIKAKEIADSNITIKYTIVITNEGDTEGFASQIIDYIPDGFTFDANNNKTWSKGENGELVNTSIAGEFIAPGESRQLTLTLSKSLTEDSTGSIINASEIGESRNASNLSDNDSMPGNKDSSEDDYSQAELLISIETGILTYTIIIILAIVILILIILVLKGKIKIDRLKYKKIKNIFSVFIITGVLGIVLSSNVYGFNVKWNTSEIYHGSNGNDYICGDAGKHLCAVNDHYYSDYGTRTNSSTSSTTSDLKTLTLTKNTSSIDTIALSDNYNLVGPYKLMSNCTESSITAVSIKYTQNGQVKESTNKNLIVDSRGNPLDLNMKRNSYYNFYIKTNVNVEAINSLKIYVTVKNAKSTTTTTKYKLIHNCTGVGDGVHHDGSGSVVYPTAGGTQRMKSYGYHTSSSTSYSSITGSATFGEVKIKGRLVINKIDPDMNGSGKPLQGIGFTLRMTSGKYQGKYVTVDKNGNAVYQSSVTTLKTNKNGEIKINLLEPGSYELIETVNPYYGYEKLPKVINSKLNIRNGGKTILNIENKRKYVKLSGYVWEDIAWDEGKDLLVNELYQDISDDANDKLLENVLVRLRDKDGNIVTFKDANGNELKQIQTDKNGKYVLWDVEIDRLDELYIEFIYNGMSYTNVKYTLDKVNGNKAGEGKNRTEYNNDYSVVVKDGTLDENGKSTYTLKYEQSDYRSQIIYNTKSESNLQYGYDGQKYPIYGTDSNFLISSTTQNAYRNTQKGKEGYLNDIMSEEDIRKNAVTEIENINLGLKERERPDLSVVKDLKSAKVTINNESHIYEYNDRFNTESKYGNGYGYHIENLDEKFNNVGVAFQEKYSSMTYTRALYASDIKYEDEDSSKELEVKVTYKIGVRNNSNSINANIYELQDYFDRKYELVNVGTDINEDGSIKEDTIIEGIRAEAYEENDEYQAMTIRYNGDNKGEALLSLKPQTEGHIYVELRVKEENLIDIVDHGIEVKLDNITEITSYGNTLTTSTDKNGNILTEESYAGIDKDSQPGNLDINNKDTWEDDTDRAPGLLIVLQETRTMSGQVFLDESGNFASGEIRQGNGQLDENEIGIEGVIVKLLKTNGDIAQMYTEEGWIDAETVTDENGEYILQGFIPGDYILAYTWGDKTYKVQDYKSTIVNNEAWNSKINNDQWYKDEFKQKYSSEWNQETGQEIRVSDAVDNYQERENIDNQITEINYRQKQEIENAYSDSVDDNNNLKTKITATTPNLKVNVEYDTDITDIRDEYEADENGELILSQNGEMTPKDIFKNNIRNIDFGLVERARQVLSLDKHIRSAKITLADGNILVNAVLDEDGNLIDKVQYVTAVPKSSVNGQVRIEVDQEIIQSAKLEIQYNLKVTNISEVEYQTQDFYMYGKGYGEDAKELVTLQPALIIDYMDNNMATDMNQNSEWEVKQDDEKQDLIDNGILSEDLEDTLKGTSRVVTTDALKDTILKPIGEDKETSVDVQLIGYRLLSSSDETFLANNAEIITIIRNNGGSTLITTPGNYNPSNLETSEVDDSMSEDISILPPTGLETYYIPYIILAISSLGILISGIVLIKKFVLINK